MSETPLQVIESEITRSRSRLFGLEAQLREFSGWFDMQAVIFWGISEEQKHHTQLVALLGKVRGRDGEDLRE